MTPAAPENPVGQLPFLDDRPDRPESVMPMDSQRIIFIRHGQTTGNINRRLDTALPGAPLTDLGVRQARSLGRLLLPDVHRIGDIVTSHALRARQTGAGAVASLHHLGETSVRIRHEGGLHEVQAGDLEGRNDRDAHMEYMRAFYQWLNGELEYRLPGGESGADVLNRYLPTIQQLLEQTGATGGESKESKEGGNKDVVIVSHGAAIRLIGQYLTGVNPEYALRHRIANTERIELVPSAVDVGKPAGIEPGTWDVRRWGDSELP
ncbi:histidine phosphatase family protein [Corynebacterium amycolatum]|uniref:histidine phosphatase family protein n=1 Tax=Corynebacterium amycolatum TaxID=43765 RepID=UPI003459920D